MVHNISCSYSKQNDIFQNTVDSLFYLCIFNVAILLFDIKFGEIAELLF